MASSSPAVSPGRIFEVGFGFAAAKVLSTAVDLGVFTELAAGDRSLEQLVERFDVAPRGARDFFDALVALGFLERDADVYRNTPEADLYLDQAKPSYVGGMFIQTNRAHYPVWQKFATGLATGEMQLERDNTVEKQFDFYEDPEQLLRFLDGMNGWIRHSSFVLAEKFPFERYGTVADIGGAAGGLLREVLVAHEQLRGIGFDLPHARAQFDAYIGAHGLTDRATFVSGDFFTDAPLPGADVLVFAHILHDWDPDIRQMLVRKAYDAVPRGGAVILLDALVDDERRSATLPLLLSLSMLLATPGGGEYTASEAESYLREAGFAQTRVEHLIGLDSIAVGIK